MAQSPRGGRYVRLVEINLHHDHARDGVCRDIVVAPSPQTVARLATFGFLTRQRPDGIDLIWDSSKLVRAGEMLAAARSEFGEMPAALRANFFASPLLFTLSLTSAAFANVTDMPTGLSIGEPPLLLTNTATTIISGTAPDLTADLMLDWTKTVTRPPEPTPAITAYLEASMSDQVKAAEAQAQMGGVFGAVGSAVASALAAALASIEAANAPPTPKNSADAEWQQFQAKSTQFALLQLHLAPPAGTKPGKGWNGFPLGAAIDPSQGPFTPCRYDLRFAARATTWRYLVAARQGTLDAASLAIVGAEDGSKGDFVRLDAPETLPDGQPAIAFESTAPIAIRQQPAKTWKLLGTPLKGRRTQTVLVPMLPVASGGRIAPATGAPPGQPPPPARSDIYVFI